MSIRSGIAPSPFPLLRSERENRTIKTRIPRMRFDISSLETAQKVPGKPRHKTREVAVGDKVVGGDNPIWVQSMTTHRHHRRRGDRRARFIAWKRPAARSSASRCPSRRTPAVLGEIKQAHRASRSSATSTSTTRWPWPPSIIRSTRSASTPATSAATTAIAR